MTEKSLEEQADEMLAELARSKGKSLRDLGILDDRTQRRIASKYEVPVSALYKQNRKGVLSLDDFEEND